ncbi:hypothetical protein PG985_008042 [Apiospora marii]|uniref:uncharacterized protein n=1 Tax=Apiospora marii TaxID=335849 RepID=UPI00312D371D
MSREQISAKFGQVEQLPDLFGNGEASDHLIKREASTEKKGQNTKKRAYKWDHEKKYAIAKARGLGIAELPENQVGQTYYQRKLTGLYHINSTGTGEKLYSFIMYDGLDVFARVHNTNMENAAYDLAALHIGQKLEWFHPNDYDLVVSKVEMTGVHSGNFAIKMSPPIDQLNQHIKTKKMRKESASVA